MHIRTRTINTTLILFVRSVGVVSIRFIYTRDFVVCRYFILFKRCVVLIEYEQVSDAFHFVLAPLPRHLPQGDLDFFFFFVFLSYSFSLCQRILSAAFSLHVVHLASMLCHGVSLHCLLSLPYY